MPNNLFCFDGCRNSGIWWFRIFGIGLVLKSPRNKPLFSERYGYRKPIIRIAGWRVLLLSRTGD
jgi:hypothetical protein